MRIERVKNFFTSSECNILNEWTKEGVKNKWLDIGFSKAVPYSLRLTSRLYPERYTYPKLAYELSNCIRTFLEIDSFPLIQGHGKDGMVVSYTFPGGDVYPHVDPRKENGLATLRCNVMTQAPDSGGILHVENQIVDIEVGELHCYLASEHEHFATPVEGQTPRIMWMFGAHVPAEDWNSGKIKLGNIK